MVLFTHQFLGGAVLEGQLSKKLDELQEMLIHQMSELNYSDYSLEATKNIIVKIREYMEQKSIDEFSVKVADAYLKIIESDYMMSTRVKNRHKAVIRHLTDCLKGEHFSKRKVTDSCNLTDNYSLIFNDYINFCKEQGNSPDTIIHKKKSFYNLFNQFSALGCNSTYDLTSELVCKSVLAEKNHVRWIDYKSIFKFLVLKGYSDRDYSTLVPSYRQRQRIPDTFTKEELSSVEQSVDTSTPGGKRDYAIILLADRLGLRTSDIRKLTLSCIDEKGKRISFYQSKTGEHIELPLLPIIQDALNDWINNARPSSDLDLVFVSIRPPYTELSPQSLNSIAKKYLNKGNVSYSGKRHGLHSFRASLATSMVNNGLSYEETRKTLGHHDNNSIKHYAALDIEKLRLCAQQVPLPSGYFGSTIGGKS